MSRRLRRTAKIALALGCTAAAAAVWAAGVLGGVGPAAPDFGSTPAAHTPSSVRVSDGGAAPVSLRASAPAAPGLATPARTFGTGGAGMGTFARALPSPLAPFERLGNALQAAVAPSGTMVINEGYAETRHTRVVINSNVAGATKMRVLPSDFTTVTVSGGGGRWAALKSDGSLWSWGTAPVGDGSAFAASSPTPILEGQRFLQVAAGLFYMVALRHDGTLWAWGSSNSDGQFGNGSTAASSLPTRAGGDRTYTQVSAGNAHVLALDASGQVWSWGDNTGWGEIGDGGTTDRLTPFAVPLPGAATKVIATYQSSFAIMANGDVYGWGANSSWGLLGLGDTANHFTPVKLPDKWIDVASGGTHTIFVKQDGSLWGVGSNWQGERGLPAPVTAGTPEALTLNMIDDGSAGPWESVRAGLRYSAGRRRDGRAYVWGTDAGPVPLQRMPDASITETATMISGDSKYAAVSAAGNLYTFSSTATATPAGFGAYAPSIYAYVPSGDGPKTLSVEYLNDAGESLVLSDEITLRSTPADSISVAAGARSTMEATPPVALSAVGAKNMRVGPRVVSIDAGEYFTALLLEDGRLLGGGSATSPRMGEGLVRSTGWFREMAPGRRWKAVSVGPNHVVAIAQDGSLWSWGTNPGWVLGVSGLEPFTVLSPICVDSSRKWKAVSAGTVHSLAIDESGALWGWGTSSNGQILGGGVHVVPTFISAGPWKCITVGDKTSAAIREDGTLWTAGEGLYGQLGIGTQPTSSSWTQVPGSWSSVSFGYRHALGIKSDGSLWAWGTNTSSCLGDGTTTLRAAPVCINSGTWRSVAAGCWTSSGVTSEGLAATWGSGADGVASSGDGRPNFGYFNTTGERVFSAVDLGRKHGIALKTDGQVWSWGTGTSGEQGRAAPASPSSGEVLVGLNGLQPYSTSTNTVLTEGAAVVSAAFVDPAGNVSWAADEVIRDAPPTTAFAGSSAWGSTDATFSLTATDPVAPVVATYYRIEAGPVVTYPGGSVLVTEPGPTTVSYWSVDASGQVEAAKTAYVKIDRVAANAMSTVGYSCETCHLGQSTAHPHEPCGLCHNKATSFGADDGSPYPVPHGGSTTGYSWSSCHCGTHETLVTWVEPGVQHQHYMDVLSAKGCDSCHAGQYPTISIKHTTDPDVAHESDGPEMDDCGICHARVLTREHRLRNRYDVTPNVIYACTTCHGATARAEAQAAVASKRTDCAACHGAVDHASYHGSTLGAECAPCHNAQLLTEHITNRGMKCRTCHAPTASQAVKDAIAANATACSGCHTAGHPHPAAAIGGRKANDERFCTDCHSTDVMVEHTKPTSSSAAGGCGACHGSGKPRGNIPGSWDLACDTAACHGPGTGREVHASYCAACHDSTQPAFATSKVTFRASQQVDRSTACVKCHWEPAGSHPYHFATWNCGSCHPGMGAIDPGRIPKVLVPGRGTFATAASAQADTDTLHAIHAAPRWPGGISKNGRQCASCHAAADCTACHEGSISPSHVDHTWDTALGTYCAGTEPAARSFAAGTTPGNESELRVNSGLTCSNATCHDISSGALVPTVIEESNAAVRFSSSPAWGRSSSTGYSGNAARVSNASGAKVDYKFTGRKIAFVSETSPASGKARVSIDGTNAVELALYSPTSVKQYVAFTSGTLASGEHTITVEVLGQRSGSSINTYVAVDAFRVFPAWGTTRTPCGTCHRPDTFTGGPVDRSTDHY